MLVRNITIKDLKLILSYLTMLLTAKNINIFINIGYLINVNKIIVIVKKKYFNKAANNYILSYT